MIPILYLSLGRDAWCAGGLHSSGLRDPFRHLSEALSGTSAVAHLIGYMPSGVLFFTLMFPIKSTSVFLKLLPLHILYLYLINKGCQSSM